MAALGRCVGSAINYQENEKSGDTDLRLEVRTQDNSLNVCTWEFKVLENLQNTKVSYKQFLFVFIFSSFTGN